MKIGLFMGRVGSGLGLTHTRPDRIWWMKIGPAADRMFRLDPLARVICWASWTHQVILGLKQIEKSKPRPKEINPEKIKKPNPNPEIKTQAQEANLEKSKNPKDRNHNPNLQRIK